MNMNPSLLADLNPEQLQAARCLKHCLTIAAPGSGKTKMLSSKAAFLLSGGKKVVAVTFTRESALELRDRIVKLAGEDALANLLVGTFHSIDLLMAFPSRAKSKMGSAILAQSTSNLKTPWKIVSESTRRSVVERAVDSCKRFMEVDEATSLIECLKSGYKAYENDWEKTLVQTYAELLKRQGVIDFQDILLETNKGLSSGSISPLATDYLLLDEYQDTDVPQYEWMMHHAQRGVVVTCVGDDDQSIYGFRRAMGYAGMVRMQSELTAERVVLGTNYRSHVEVLSPAATLIGHNADRMDKALVAFKGIGGSVQWERFNTRELESAGCMQELLKAHALGAKIGVLARTNKRLEALEALLVRERIEYSKSSGSSILDTREAAVTIAAMSCLVRDDQRDADEVLSWCGVDEEDLAAIHKACKTNCLLGDGKRASLKEWSIKDGTRSLIVKLRSKIPMWLSYANTGGNASLAFTVCELLSEHADGEYSKNNLHLVSLIFSKKKDDQSLADRIAKIRQVREKEKSQAQVSLMTAHGSKGLEFDWVWILGAEDDKFPDPSSSVQEERRLFYVAMTRARKTLWVSAAGKAAHSKFIDEAMIPRTPNETFVGLKKP